MATAQSDVVAILDVGKTLTRLLLIDAADGRTLRQFERPSVSVPSPLGPQLDVAGIERWLRAQFVASPERGQIHAIVPIAHGAAAVPLDAQGTVLAAPDYENPDFDEVAASYRPLRDAFSATFSPFLPRGLNIGRQFYWLQQRAPELLQRCETILTYPQYWAWRLTGVPASEWTSLGCHTDMWFPRTQQPSNLAVNQGWATRLPPVRSAAEVLGPVLPEWVLDCELNPDCVVVCGIHDSSASYLAQSLRVPQGKSFAVVSSGTWTVVMARGVELQRLVESRDMLANIDIAGQAVGTARFAGGREYGAIAGSGSECIISDEPALQRVLQQGAMALPSFSDVGGPFGGKVGRLIGGDGLNPIDRAALASLYLALMTDLLLEWLGVRGEVLLDGPLAENTLYGRVLASLRPAQTVRGAARHSGAVRSALHLAGHVPDAEESPSALAPLEYIDELRDYRWRWRCHLPSLPM